MEKIFFSVIIPTYNRAEFIINTLESVFNQKFKNYEVIIVDNLSTDNTLEVLDYYLQNNKIKLIVNDRNYERSYSRNIGARLAKGQYITYLDSDDFMYQNNLYDAYEFAINNKKFKIFHNLYELVDNNKNCIYRYNFKKIDNPLDEIVKGNFLSCIGVFFHQDVFKEIEWDDNPLLTGSEDYDFSLRAICLFRDVGRIEKINSGILQHSFRTVNNKELNRAILRIEYFIKKLNINSIYFSINNKYKIQIISTLYIHVAYVAISANKNYAVFKYLLYAFKINKYVIFKRDFVSILFRLILKGK